MFILGCSRACSFLLARFWLAARLTPTWGCLRPLRLLDLATYALFSLSIRSCDATFLGFFRSSRLAVYGSLFFLSQQSLLFLGGLLGYGLEQSLRSGLRFGRIDYVLQVLIQTLDIGLSELFIGEYTLHYIGLVLSFDEAALDAQTLLSVVFADGVGDLFHPDALLPLL